MLDEATKRVMLRQVECALCCTGLPFSVGIAVVFRDNCIFNYDRYWGRPAKDRAPQTHCNAVIFRVSTRKSRCFLDARPKSANYDGWASESKEEKKGVLYGASYERRADRF